MRIDSVSPRLTSSELPIVVDDALRVAIPGGCAHLTPRQALNFSEDLIRRATRRAVIEASLDVQPTKKQAKRSAAR